MLGLRISAVAVALVAASSAGLAADLPVRPAAPPPLPPVYNWTGFYLGGNVGEAWASGTLTDSFTGASATASKNAIIGGGQLGYNFQTGNFVFGAEWDFDWTALQASGIIGSRLAATANTNWITTVAGRFGWAANNLLFYGKAGGGWVNNSATVTNVVTGTSLSASNTNVGWLVGGGIEYAVAPNWTLKLEYDYLGLNTWTFDHGVLVTPSRFSVDRQVNMLTAGFNYKF